MITLEPFTGADRQLAAMVQIEQVSAPLPWSRHMFATEIARPDAWWILASGPSAIVGFVGLHIVVDEGHIVNIAVDPNRRLHRVATTLLLAAFEEAVQRKVRAMTLEVRASNLGAQRLYHRFGFVPAGVRRGYYPATPEQKAEDGVVMWTEELASESQSARLERIRSSISSRVATS